MAETTEQLIRRIAAEEGIDPALAVAMARQESGLSPRAVGDGGHSIGLFQLHDQGMGAGMGDARYDPETNARTALHALAQTLKARPDLAGNPGALAAASQRPADPAGYARSVNAMLTGGAGTSHTGSPFAPNSPTTGGRAVADPRIDTYTAQRDALKTRLDANRKALADAQALVDDYEKSSLHDKEYFKKNTSVTKAQIITARELLDPKTSRLQAQIDKDEPALRDVEADLAAAQRDASKPPSASSQYLNTDASDQFIIKRNADGTIVMKPDGSGPETIANPNYRAPTAPVPHDAPLTAEMVAAESAANVRQSTGSAAASEAAAARTSAMTPYEVAKAQSDAEQAKYKNARDAFIADWEKQVAADPTKAAEAIASIKRFDAVHQTPAEAFQAGQLKVMQDTAAETARNNAELRKQAAAAAQQQAARDEEARRHNVAGEDYQTKSLQSQERGQNVAAATSIGNEASRAALASLAYLAPPGTAEDLAGIRNALATGTRPPPTTVRSMPFPFDPTKVAQDATMRALAALGVSPPGGQGTAGAAGLPVTAGANVPAAGVLPAAPPPAPRPQTFTPPPAPALLPDLPNGGAPLVEPAAYANLFTNNPVDAAAQQRRDFAYPLAYPA